MKNRTSPRPAPPPAVEQLYAARADGITGSVIDSSTSLLESQQHDVVRLAMGSPAAEAVPTERFAEILAGVGGSGDAYDYGPTEGDAGLRAALLELLAARGDALAPEQLLVTTGGMQGIDLVCKLFVGPGDVAAVEAPTYTNGVATITGYRGTLLAVPTDDDGMDVDALEQLVADGGRAPKVIYTVPTFQNPAGTTLSLERRIRLLELAARWRSILLEDDPYSLLRFEGADLPSLRALSDGRVRVIGVHTFSKVIAPGLRVGWLVAEPAVIERMIAARQAMDTCTNTLQQRLVARFLSEGDFDGHVARLREEYRRRKQAMQAALHDHFGDMAASWTDPQGGFFLWLRLPEQVDTGRLFPAALAAGVAYIPGPAFSVDGGCANELRLAFSAEPPERARIGIARLRAAVDAELGRSRAEA